MRNSSSPALLPPPLLGEMRKPELQADDAALMEMLRKDRKNAVINSFAKLWMRLSMNFELLSEPALLFLELQNG